MKKRTQWALMSSPAFFLVIFILLWTQFLQPKTEQWLLEYLHSFNEKSEDFQFKIKTLQISLLRLQVNANDIEIFSKIDSKQLNPISVDHIRLQGDPFQFVVGQPSISSLYINGIKTSQNLSVLKKFFKTDKKSSEKIILKPFFDVAEKIPLTRIVLSKANLEIKNDTSDYASIDRIELENKEIYLAHKRRKLKTRIEPIQIRFFGKNTSNATARIFAQAELDEYNYKIENAEIQLNQSKFKFSSESNDLENLLIQPQTTTDIRAEIKLDEIKSFSYLFKFDKKRVPQILGQFDIAGRLKTDNFDKNKGSFKITTEEVRVDNLKLGNANAEIQILNNEVKVNELFISHPSGEAELSQIKFKQKAPYEFSAQVQAHSFNLQKLFLSLNLNNIPAFLDAQATAECQGQLSPLSIQCQTQIQGKNIDVKPSMKDALHIVEIEQATAHGQVSLTNEKLNFNAQLKIKDSMIQSEGDVHFEDGFKMKFKSNDLDLSTIKNIANLDLKGKISGELSTEGTTSWGTLQSKLSAQDFQISQFQTGQFNTELSYKKGHLQLQKINGQLRSSEYNGEIDLNFQNSTLEGRFQLPKVQAEDVIYSLEKKWNLQLDLEGQGQAQIEFKGPFDFWDLEYNLKSQFSRTRLLGELFNKIDLNLKSTQDRIYFENVVLKKPNGFIKISETIETPANTDPFFQLKIQTEQLRAEDSDHLGQSFKSLSGQIYVLGGISGHVSNPLITLNTQFKNVNLDSMTLPPSQGELKVDLEKMTYDGQIFGRQIQAFIQIPFHEKQTYEVSAQIKDLNPFLFLPLIQLPLPASDTFANLSGNINLKSTNHDFKTLKGTIELEQLSIQRNTQFLKLVQPSFIQWNGQLRSMTPLELKGPEQYVKAELTNKNTLQFSGRLYARLFQFLVPFSENLSGILEFDCFSKIDTDKFNLSGEGLLDNGTVQMKGFKYPLQNINAYFDFNQSKIIFTDISAELNQTAISGSGHVDIQGPQNIVVLLNADTEKLDLDFPPQFQTSGYAKVQFFGNWLPYTLKINYQIDQGQITKEFTDDSELLSSVRPSPMLPPQRLKAQNETLLLKVNADFSKGVFVKNRIFEGIASGILNIEGTPEIPLIKGKIDIATGSRLIFKDKPFEIQNGFIEFDGDHQINPTIQISSNARISDYDVSLIAQGKAKNLDIKTTSQPYLSREDIISLLALGYTSSKSEQNLNSDLQQQQTGLEVLAALSNQSQINKKLEQKLGLNVQLTPSVDSTKNIAVPKVVVSKKLSKKVTTSYSRPLTGENQENEIRLQYLWRKDWSLILNYQNQTTQDNSIIQNKKSDDGIGGIDLEFKKEFD